MTRTLTAAGLLCLILVAGCAENKVKKGTANLTELKIETVTPGQGEGAKVGDRVFVEYTGQLTDKTVFDSNEGKTDRPPFGFVVGEKQVIEGWDTGIIGTKVGETRRLSVPARMGYGAQDQEKIPANSDLFFTLKVVDMIRKGEEGDYTAKDSKSGSGPQAKEGDTVEFHYMVEYINGMKVDDSKKRGEPVKVKVGVKDGTRMIAGLDDGVRGMRPGGVRVLRIPPDLAYGAMGNQWIQGGQILNITVEMISVNGAKS